MLSCTILIRWMECEMMCLTVIKCEKYREIKNPQENEKKEKNLFDEFY